MSDRKPSVLFLGSHDSVRSQMAAALLRHRAGDGFDVHSAGLAPTAVHPLTKQVLEEVGVDTTLLEPMRPFATHTLPWPSPDPSRLDAGRDDVPAAFRALRDRLDGRVRDWIEEQEVRVFGQGVEVGAGGRPTLRPGV